MKTKMLSLAVVTALGLNFSGCGSDSSDNDTQTATNETQTGTFIDAPVKGLYYKTETQSGYTDENGNFKYKVGEIVEFKLANLSLGSVEAGGLISPYTIAKVATGVDNNLSTNIALLLQNLDANRTNSKVLDLSQLKNFNFTDINLSSSTTAMETTLSNKLTAGIFDNFIDPNNKSILDTDTVKNSMKTFVENENKIKNNVSNIIGKEYNYVECSNLFGCEKKGLFSYNSNGTISGVDYEENKEFSYNYTIEENGLIKVVWDWGTDYTKILNISSDMVTACSSESEQEALNCIDTEEYYITSNSIDSFITTKNKFISDSILTNKTLVTNLSEIQNKMFYKLYSGHIMGMKIIDNQLQNFSGTTYSDMHWNGWEGQEENSYYDIIFLNNLLSIKGIMPHNGSSYSSESKVYKYDLSGKTIDKNIFIQEAGWEADNTAQLIKIDNFTFTSGNMYCDMLWEECWVDEDAIKQMEEQQISPYIDTVSVEHGFGKDYLKNKTFYIVAQNSYETGYELRKLEINDSFIQQYILQDDGSWKKWSGSSLWIGDNSIPATLNGEPVTQVDGALAWSDWDNTNNEHVLVWAKVTNVSADESIISLSGSSDFNKLFTNESDAESYLNSL